jgi:UDP-N-acetylmuramoyl-tripeptide--D-alanyl-D-alanine ligase
MIRQGIEAYVPRNNRSQLIKRGNLTILLDAYNANPTSMRAAIENLARYEGPKWAVLGDMLELGPKAAAKHQEIVDLLARKKIPAYLIGEHFGRTKPHAHILGRFAATDDFIRSGLFDGLNEGTVLIKGSRGLRLERILEK